MRTYNLIGWISCFLYTYIFSESKHIAPHGWVSMFGCGGKKNTIPSIPLASWALWRGIESHRIRLSVFHEALSMGIFPTSVTSACCSSTWSSLELRSDLWALCIIIPLVRSLNKELADVWVWVKVIKCLPAFMFRCCCPRPRTDAETKHSLTWRCEKERGSREEGMKDSVWVRPKSFLFKLTLLCISKSFNVMPRKTRIQKLNNGNKKDVISEGRLTSLIFVSFMKHFGSSDTVKVDGMATC